MDSCSKKPDQWIKKGTSFIGIGILIAVIGGLLADNARADSDNFYSDIILLDNVVTRIHQNYVDPVKSRDLVDKAVEGMLQILDPHTSYFQSKDYEELRIHTEGKFGGLGIQISIRDNALTVMTPISGTPAWRAGIQSGDHITKIDGKPTKGIRLDSAVSKLRGAPGTSVSLSIIRRGEPKELEYAITREVIHIKSVPFSGVVFDSIGYIRLNTFSEDAGQEVEKAIKGLLGKNIKGLVLDLRSNPGGLLPQAIEVTARFLPRKSLVVYTRGRTPEQNREYHVGSNPVLPADIPLTVLVSPASASASEIVAGAIQDWDRGLVVGDTTFGKGSVQSVLPLDKKHHLKLTTAYYYTPSGRCINRPERSVRKGAGGDETAEEESEEESEGVGPSRPSDRKPSRPQSRAVDTTTYRTKNGRIVRGGGGIIPDSVVVPPKPDFIIGTLFGKDVFFRFANVEHPRLKKKKVRIDERFTVDDAVMKDFLGFLDSIKFEYKSFSQISLDDFRTRIGLLPDTTADSAIYKQVRPQWTSEDKGQLVKALETVNQILARERDRDFEKRQNDIRKHLRDALLIREYGQDNEVVFRAALSEDVQLKTAVALMGNQPLYRNLLSGKGAPKKQAQ